MKRFLLPLLAAVALPTAVNAESAWLILAFDGDKKALEAIQMRDIDQCEEQGAIWMSGKMTANRNRLNYECLEGK